VREISSREAAPCQHRRYNRLFEWRNRMYGRTELKAGVVLVSIALLGPVLGACEAGRGGEAGTGSGENGTSRAGVMPENRDFTVQQWDTLWAIGGPEDTLLQRPSFLSSAGDRLFVYDGGARRVLAFQASTGRLEWTFGREGAGPDEFRGVRDIKADGHGGVYALDPRNHRVTHLDSSGRAVRRIALTGVGHSDQFFPLPDGRLVLLTNSSDSAFAVVGRDGSIEERFSLEWDGFSELHNLARQGYMAGEGDQWAFGFSFGNGWVPFERTTPRSHTGRYVEHTEFPTIRQQGTTAMFAEYTPCSACSLAVSEGHLYVHFGGSRDALGEVVDRYDQATGSYVGSLRLPVKANTVTVSGGRVYVLFDDPYPMLLAMAPGAN
jgi:outer membrane protein assembly factor BamB